MSADLTPNDRRQGERRQIDRREPPQQEHGKTIGLSAFIITIIVLITIVIVAIAVIIINNNKQGNSTENQNGTTSQPYILDESYSYDPNSESDSPVLMTENDFGLMPEGSDIGLPVLETDDSEAPVSEE